MPLDFPNIHFIDESDLDDDVDDIDDDVVDGNAKNVILVRKTKQNKFLF